MGATKTLKQREEILKDRIKKHYPDYTLITPYPPEGARGDIALRHKDGHIWNTKPRYLDDKGTCGDPAFFYKKRKVSHRGNKPMTQQEYEERFYSRWSIDVYEIVGPFSKVHTNIAVLCKKCGEVWYPKANDMIHDKISKGCKYCYGTIKPTLEEYKKQVEDLTDKEYTVIADEYIDCKIPIKMKHFSDICNNHEYDCSPNEFINHNARCPRCNEILGESLGSRMITKYLETRNIEYQKEVCFKDCRDILPLPFDFYIESYDMLIEFDGKQHFEPSYGSTKENKIKNLEKTQKHDRIKDEWAIENNMNFIRISYKEMSDIEKLLDDFFNNCAESII